MPSSARSHLLMPLVLAAVVGCQDLSPPTQPVGPKPHFAQGDGGVYTVNSLADPGDGTCDDTECTLREAIAAAAAIATTTTITFAPGLSGEILLQGGRLELEDMSTTIDGEGRISLNANLGSTVMDITANSSEEVTLTGLTFKNGVAPGTISSRGGGILASGNGLVLHLEEVTISNSSALTEGGGMALFGSPVATLLNSVITGNHATLNGQGGGIHVGQSASLSLINTTVEGNTAQDGGGIFNAGTLVVTGSTLSGNTATETGGALSNASGASATVMLSTLSGNGANEGGGIWSEGTLALRSVTITRNTGNTNNEDMVPVDGGIVVGGPTTVANSIIAGNQGNCSTFAGGALASLGYNIGCTFSATGDVQVDPAQVFTEVLEQELADNGGPTKTHALIVRGRAVDAGYCPGETTDQRELPRPADDATMTNALDGCDIGAYELQGPVTPIADLMISQTVNKTSVKQGDLLTYFIRVQNLGPETAPNATVTNVLSTGVTFVEARAGKGSFTAPPKGETGTVTWYLGDLLDQANEVAEIEVTVLIKGKTTITNSASVAADVVDPNQANNAASITVSVGAGSTGKGGKQK